MTGLDITQEAFETEKRVVIEEYNQRYLNQPYGDQWMLMRDMAYKVHPYRWATIGLTPEHIEKASLEEVRAFYERFYNPSDAILSVAADIDPAKIIVMAEKWFGGVHGPHTMKDPIPQEPEQTEARRMEVERDVPATAVTIAFKMGRRTDRQFYQGDIISDLLAGGTSARLYRSLVQERRLFTATNAYVSGDVDPGLFVVTGQVAEGVTAEEGESAIWDELHRLQQERVPEYELEKVKNKFEAGVTFGELNVMNKAMNLGFYSMLGDMSLLNGEIDIFRSISAEEVMEGSQRLFAPQRSSTLIYRMGNGSK